MNDREIQGWKEIGRRTPRRIKFAASAVVIMAIAAFGALVAFVGVNAFAAATATPASVAVAAPTKAPATIAPAAPATTAPSTAAPSNPAPGNGGRGFGRHPEGSGPRGFGGGFGMRGMPFFGNLDLVAKALNLTTDQLRSQLASGKSLSDIATAQNVNIQAVKDALTSSMKAQLDQMVSAGRLPQSKADQILSGFTNNLDTLVNAKLGRRGFGWPQEQPQLPGVQS